MANRDTQPISTLLCIIIALPGTGCWCTAAAETQGACPGWWQAEPSAAALSGWGCPAGHELRPQQHTSLKESLLRTGLHTAAVLQRWNWLKGRKKWAIKHLKQCEPSHVIYLQDLKLLLTINGGGQQCSNYLPLAFLVFIEETLKTVKDRTAKHKWLSLIYHGHEQHHNGWSVGTWRREVTIGFRWIKAI